MTSFPRTRRTAIERANDALLAARWRVGLRGSMQLAITIDSNGRARAEWTLSMDPESANTRQLTFDCSVTETRDERRLVLSSENDAVRCTLALPNGVEGAPLMVTDLPERVGLRGGTYVLEELRVGF